MNCHVTASGDGDIDGGDYDTTADADAAITAAATITTTTTTSSIIDFESLHLIYASCLYYWWGVVADPGHWTLK